MWLVCSLACIGDRRLPSSASTVAPNKAFCALPLVFPSFAHLQNHKSTGGFDTLAHSNPRDSLPDGLPSSSVRWRPSYAALTTPAHCIAGPFVSWNAVSARRIAPHKYNRQNAPRWPTYRYISSQATTSRCPTVRSRSSANCSCERITRTASINNPYSSTSSRSVRTESYNV